jgi:hypothetical protein
VIGKLTSKGAFSQDVTLAGPLQSFSAGGDFSNSVVSVDSIGAITIKGNVTNGQFESSQAASEKGKPIGKVNVSGDISNTLIRAVGNITSVTATSLTGSTIFAGVSDNVNLRALPAQAADFTAPSSIGTVTLKGGFADSRIAASKLNKVTLGIVNTSNNGTSFGVAGDSISSLTGALETSTLSLRKLATQEDVTTQTSGLALGDLAITVVEAATT